jgi:hypothetical protein
MADRPATQIIFVRPDGSKENGPLVPLSPEPKRVFDDVQWDKDRCFQEFHGALHDQNSDAVEASMRAMDRLRCWREAFEHLIDSNSSVTGESMLWFWTSYGPHVTDSLKGDPILFEVMKRRLPPYAGTGHTLYRGETWGRYERHVYGMSWTTDIEVARMFAERRDPPGVVLMLGASAEMIIAGPTAHSEHLQEQEHLVDPSTIQSVRVISL